MKISILASIKDYPRINPLLWNLFVHKPNQKFELILINFLNTQDEIISNQLNEFRSAYKWSLYKPGEEFNLTDLVEDNVLSLPASCIPHKNAINLLINNENSYCNAKSPGALLAFNSSKYNTDINQMILDDCIDTNVGIWYGTKGFILNHHAGIFKLNKEPIFIILDNIYNTINCDMKLDLVEKNH